MRLAVSLCLSVIITLVPSIKGGCLPNYKEITVHSPEGGNQVCVKPYSLIKYCSFYYTEKPPLRFQILSQLSCNKCDFHPLQQFVVSLSTLENDPMNEYYLSCIPTSLRTGNCQFYIEYDFKNNDNNKTERSFKCGACPSSLPLIVKGTKNEFSFCADKQVRNCAKYKQSGVNRYGLSKLKCEQCQPNYTLELTGSCLPFVQNCAQYDSQRLCLKCNDKFSLKNNTCIPTNQPNSTIQNISESACMVYSRRYPTQCTVCEQSYVLFEGGCYFCGQGNYINRDNQCVSGKVENCQQYNSDGECLICKVNHQFSEDLSKCVMRKVENVCPGPTSKVKYVYENGSGKCIAIDINCAEGAFNSNGCYACEMGFYNYKGVCYFLR